MQVFSLFAREGEFYNDFECQVISFLTENIWSLCKVGSEIPILLLLWQLKITVLTVPGLQSVESVG